MSELREETIPLAKGAVAERKTPTDRKPRKKRWLQILKAAAEVFYEKGYEAATLQDISDRVGILKGSIYYYIKTKGDLLDSLLTEVHNEGLAMIRERAATEGTVLDKLASMIQGHIDYICRNQAKTTVYLHELKALSREHRESLFRGDEFRNEFMQVIEEGQKQGLILPHLDPKLTAQAMLGFINSLYQWYTPSAKRPPQLIADHFKFTALRGIASDKGLKLLPSR
jgi:AcrR family transcriptional regulator